MKDRIGLEEIDHTRFQAMEGDEFELHIGESVLAAKLVEVTHHGARAAPGASREPFSIVFQLAKGAAAEPGLYRLEHQSLEPMDLLMTPLAPDSDAAYLEAVFG